MPTRFSAIKKAFLEIEKRTKIETKFSIEDVEIVIETLGDRDETDILSECYSIVDKKNSDASSPQEFMYWMKVNTLSRSIKRINGIDLSNKYIVLDELDDDGNEIKVAKHKVVSDLISTWPRVYISRAFAKYGELIAKIEIDAEKSIVADVIDFDSEISRLKERIEELELERDNLAKKNAEKGNRLIGVASGIAQMEVNNNADLAREVMGEPEEDGLSGSSFESIDASDFRHQDAEEDKEDTREKERNAPRPTVNIKRDQEPVRRRDINPQGPYDVSHTISDRGKKQVDKLTFNETGGTVNPNFRKK
jgi:hypothetical protein